MTHDKQFRSGRLARMATAAALALAWAAPAAWAFPPPVTPSFPADLAPEQFVVDLNNVQTVSKPLKIDQLNNDQAAPEVYWFKYTADGMSKVQFDLLGTNISTLGLHPGYEDGNYASLGFGTYDQTQIAVYDSAGQMMGTSIGWYDDTGHSVLKFNPQLYSEFYPPEPEFPQNPGFADSPIIFNGPNGPVDFSDVVSQGLARVVFEPNAPTNPRWDADPDDPNPLDPDQYGDLNEYEVWDTAITSVIEGGPGWRAGDRARHGPGARWDRYEILPAGEYFIAISSGSPTYSGDVYPEEILQAPIHFDADTQTDDVPVLTENMGPFQYYLANENPNFPRQYGVIVLNVRHEALLLLGDANNDGQVTGADLIAVQQNFGNTGTDDGTLLGDANDDGQVTGADLIAVQQNFGNTLAPVAAQVPEPATLLIIGAAGLLALRRRSS